MNHNVAENRAGISADEALQRLIAGNERFVLGESEYDSRLLENLANLTQGQQPFATILGCSDSRVPPELIFDVGLGELFVVRVAGNVFASAVAGSLQYAGRHLETQLFMVLGHEGCGAVSAALESRDLDERERSRIQELVDCIVPGLPASDQGLSPKEQLDRAVESNVRWTVKQILDSPEGKVRQAEGRYMIVGAIYELASGKVRLLH